MNVEAFPRPPIERQRHNEAVDEKNLFERHFIYLDRAEKAALHGARDFNKKFVEPLKKRFSKDRFRTLKRIGTQAVIGAAETVGIAKPKKGKVVSMERMRDARDSIVHLVKDGFFESAAVLQQSFLHQFRTVQKEMGALLEMDTDDESGDSYEGLTLKELRNELSVNFRKFHNAMAALNKALLGCDPELPDSELLAAVTDAVNLFDVFDLSRKRLDGSLRRFSQALSISVKTKHAGANKESIGVARTAGKAFASAETNPKLRLVEQARNSLEIFDDSVFSAGKKLSNMLKRSIEPALAQLKEHDANIVAIKGWEYYQKRFKEELTASDEKNAVALLGITNARGILKDTKAIKGSKPSRDKIRDQFKEVLPKDIYDLVDAYILKEVKSKNRPTTGETVVKAGQRDKIDRFLENLQKRYTKLQTAMAQIAKNGYYGSEEEEAAAKKKTA